MSSWTIFIEVDVMFTVELNNDTVDRLWERYDDAEVGCPFIKWFAETFDASYHHKSLRDFTWEDYAKNRHIKHFARFKNEQEAMLFLLEWL